MTFYLNLWWPFTLTFDDLLTFSFNIDDLFDLTLNLCWPFPSHPLLQSFPMKLPLKRSPPLKRWRRKNPRRWKRKRRRLSRRSLSKRLSPSRSSWRRWKRNLCTTLRRWRREPPWKRSRSSFRTRPARSSASLTRRTNPSSAVSLLKVCGESTVNIEILHATPDIHYTTQWNIWILRWHTVIFLVKPIIL